VSGNGVFLSGIIPALPYSVSMDEGKTKDNVQYLAINAGFLPN